MNTKASWDSTGDLLEAIDPKPQNAIFSHTHSYTKNVVESYSLHDFDLNVLLLKLLFDFSSQFFRLYKNHLIK